MNMVCSCNEDAGWKQKFSKFSVCQNRLFKCRCLSLTPQFLDSVGLKRRICFSHKFTNDPDADDSKRPPLDLLTQSDKWLLLEFACSHKVKIKLKKLEWSFFLKLGRHRINFWIYHLYAVDNVNLKGPRWPQSQINIVAPNGKVLERINKMFHS